MSIIETHRLRLRPHRVEDFERYWRLWMHPEPPGAPMPLNLSAEEVWARLLRFVGHWSHFAYGLFIVEDRTADEVVGEVGIAHFHRGVDERFDSAPEAAWRVRQDRRGEGIASEAMSAALQWFDRSSSCERTVCMIHPTNAPSMSVADRLGYRRFGDGYFHGEMLVLLERQRTGIAPRM